MSLQFNEWGGRLVLFTRSNLLSPAWPIPVRVFHPWPVWFDPEVTRGLQRQTLERRKPW